MSAYPVEWPNTYSVSITLPIHIYYFPPTVIGILYRMVEAIAYRGVNSFYREASPDPFIEGDRIQRITGCTDGEWNDAFPYVREFFVVKDGEWRLGNFDFIRYSKPTVRDPLPSATKAAVLARDGRRCVYCGTLEGPFHFDHLFPFSRGGSDTPANLVIACVPCNSSKRDMTLREWMENMR